MTKQGFRIVCIVLLPSYFAAFAADGLGAYFTPDDGGNLVNMHEYWERTWDAWLRLRFWRVNPVKASWRLARDSREAMIFLFALWSERY